MNNAKRPANAVGTAYNTALRDLAKAAPNEYSVSSRWIRPRQRRIYNVYTDEDKAKIVAICATCAELGQTTLARTLKVKQNQISEWTRGQHISQEALAMADDYKERIKEKFENILEMALDVMPDKVDKASFWDLARATGLAFDKIQLMEGKPTVISGNELPANERARMIFALIGQAKERQALEAHQPDLVQIQPLEAVDVTAEDSDESR